MKKAVLTIAALALTASVAGAGVFAAGRTAGVQGNPGGIGWNYVDADGDGVCDNRANGMCGRMGNRAGRCGMRGE